MKDLGIDSLISYIRKIGIYILIFLSLFAIRIAAIQMKTTLFCDDPFTFIASAPTNLTPEGHIAKSDWETYNFEQGKFYTVEQIKKSLFSMDLSLKSIIKDIKTIRSSNIERQHPTLYFYIMRIWGAGLDGLDTQTLIYRGCFLNLIFFTLSFFFMFKLLSIIRNDKKFIAFGLIFGFISTGSIVNIIFIRPYAMQECFLILVSYIFVLLYKKIKQNESLTYKQILFYSSSFSLLLLSGYFSLIFMGLVYFTLICICVFYKRFSHLKFIFVILFFTVLITIFAYPTYFDLWTNNGHIKTVSENAFVFNLSSFKINLIFTIELLSHYILYTVLLIPICVILILKKYIIGSKFLINDSYNIDKENLLPIVYLLLITLLWSVISIHISPIKTVRYIAPASVIFSLIFSLCVYKFKTIIQYIIIVLFIIFSITAPYSIKKHSPDLANGIQLPFVTMTYEKEINGLFYKFNHKSIPLIITGQHWFNVNYFILMDNDKLIKFEDIDYINNNNLKDYYALITIPKTKYIKIHAIPIHCIANMCIYSIDN